MEQFIKKSNFSLKTTLPLKLKKNDICVLNIKHFLNKLILLVCMPI